MADENGGVSEAPAEAVPAEAAVADGFAFDVPDGFFDEVSAQLRDLTAEEVSEAVITVCMARGLLHAELEEEPDSELRAEELREVFRLVELTAQAVSDGTVTAAHSDDEQFDEDMFGLWEGFTDAAADEAVNEQIQALTSSAK